MIFALIDYKGREWWQEAGNYWKNEEGDFVGKDKVKPISLVEAPDFSCLDYKLTDIYQPDLDTGWLSPTGNFTGCATHDHDAVARKIIRVSVTNLEKSGWGRVQNKIVMYREPTNAQITWAFDHQKEFHQL